MELLRNNATIAMLMVMQELYNEVIRKVYGFRDDVKQQVKDILAVAKEWGYCENKVDNLLAKVNVKR